MALGNLGLVFGISLTGRALRRIGRGSFASAGRQVAVFAHLPRVDRAWVARHVVFEGLERYHRARAEGKGVLYLAAHFGAWELIPAAQAALGLPMAFIVRPADNPLLEAILRRYRSRNGNRPVAKQDALRVCLRILRGGGTVGILIDQRVAPERGIRGTFLGQPVDTTPVLATLALRSGAPVLPVFALREGPGRHRIVFAAPVTLPRGEDREEDVAGATGVLNAAIEEFVLARPDHWLWAHRRFRRS